MPENYYSLIFDPTKKPKEFDYQWEMDRAADRSFFFWIGSSIG